MKRGRKEKVIEMTNFTKLSVCTLNYLSLSLFFFLSFSSGSKLKKPESMQGKLGKCLIAMYFCFWFTSSLSLPLSLTCFSYEKNCFKIIFVFVFFFSSKVLGLNREYFVLIRIFQ